MRMNSTVNSEDITEEAVLSVSPDTTWDNEKKISERADELLKEVINIENSNPLLKKPSQEDGSEPNLNDSEELLLPENEALGVSQRNDDKSTISSENIGMSENPSESFPEAYEAEVNETFHSLEETEDIHEKNSISNEPVFGEYASEAFSEDLTSKILNVSSKRNKEPELKVDSIRSQRSSIYNKRVFNELKKKVNQLQEENARIKAAKNGSISEVLSAINNKLEESKNLELGEEFKKIREIIEGQGNRSLSLSKENVREDEIDKRAQYDHLKERLNCESKINALEEEIHELRNDKSKKVLENKILNLEAELKLMAEQLELKTKKLEAAEKALSIRKLKENKPTQTNIYPTTNLKKQLLDKDKCLKQKDMQLKTLKARLESKTKPWNVRKLENEIKLLESKLQHRTTLLNKKVNKIGSFLEQASAATQTSFSDKFVSQEEFRKLKKSVEEKKYLENILLEKVDNFLRNETYSNKGEIFVECEKLKQRVQFLELEQHKREKEIELLQQGFQQNETIEDETEMKDFMLNLNSVVKQIEELKQG
eukprot:augustus_masked-scaffold_11-processed-gene-2.45-mRNA-1 protein AED:1.00 eAED:1.00 QI:0/-1/0/0/-1/1/1/0/540